MCISVQDQLYCWGDNSRGQLGIGTTASWAVPQVVAQLARWSAVSVGAYHSCAIAMADPVVGLQEGTAFCWGDGAFGQIGVGNLSNQPSPREVSGGERWLTLSAGAIHTCGQTGDGVFCWGENVDGRLGIGNTVRRTVPTRLPMSAAGDTISAGGKSTLWSGSTTDVFSWGLNENGQLGRGTVGGLDSIPSLAFGCSNC